MEYPLVSIIIPNYNYAHYVGAAIESALNQDYPNKEIIVINNGSTDNSIEVLKKYKKAHPSIFNYVDQKNMGQAGARNRGILESSGEFIAFLDADDIWKPEKLSKQMPLFEEPNVGLVYCTHWTTDKDLNPLKEIRFLYRGELLESFAFGVTAIVSGGESTAVIRRECFAQLGIFDTSLSNSSGWDMFRRISTRYKIEVVPESLTLYRQHGTNASQRLDVYERELLQRTKKMLEDPTTDEKLRSHKRSTYQNVYFALSASYLKTRNVPKAMFYLGRSVLKSPAGTIKSVLLPYPKRIPKF